MEAPVMTSEISDLVHECEQVNAALWEYNTRGKKKDALDGVESVLPEFRKAAQAALLQQEVIEPSGTEKMLKYVTAFLDEEKLHEKPDGVSVLLQTMKLKLQQTFCSVEKKIFPEFVPADTKKLRNFGVTCMIRYHLEALGKVGEEMCNPLLAEENIIKHMMQEGGCGIVATNGYGGGIASYALFHIRKSGVHFTELKATPYYEDTAARHYLLKGFDWSIPHNTLKGMERYLTTAPIDIRHTKETAFFGSHDFIAFGGTRDKHGELTHVRLGKLTDEFKTWGTI